MDDLVPSQSATSPAATATQSPPMAARHTTQPPLTTTPSGQPEAGVGANKELGPIIIATGEAPISEPVFALTSSELPETHLAPELREAGVEDGEHTKEQTAFKAMQQAGSELAITNQQAVPQQKQQSSLPMTREQAVATKKQGSVWDSFSWLAALVLFQWKKQSHTE